MTFSGVNIFRFGDEGKVVEIWNHRDDLGLKEQLGHRCSPERQPRLRELRLLTPINVSRPAMERTGIDPVTSGLQSQRSEEVCP